MINRNEILEIIKEELYEEMTLDSKLEDYLDSIETSELIMIIEDKYKINIPDDIEVSGSMLLDEFLNKVEK